MTLLFIKNLGINIMTNIHVSVNKMCEVPSILKLAITNFTTVNL